MHALHSLLFTWPAVGCASNCISRWPRSRQDVHTSAWAALDGHVNRQKFRTPLETGCTWQWMSLRWYNALLYVSSKSQICVWTINRLCNKGKCFFPLEQNVCWFPFKMNDFGRINQTLQLIASNFYLQNTILEKKRMITASSSFATSAKQIKVQDALDEITVVTLQTQKQKKQSALKAQQLLKKNPQRDIRFLMKQPWAFKNLSSA